MKRKNQDEFVDGPKIAAQILNHMPSAHKGKILQAIKRASPGISKQIEKNFYNFNDIAKLSDQGVQRLLKEIDHQALVVSFKKAGDNVKAVFLRNMSERKRQMVLEDFSALPPMPVSEVEAAQQKIIQKLDELRTHGLVLTESSDDIWV